MYREAVLFLLAGAASFGELVESPAWVEFAVNCTGPNRSESVLSDFSYAGYRFSNAQIPDVSDCQRLSVADYGVLPDDQSFDDEGIQAAIDAAVAADEPTVVFFPAGRYMVGDEAHARTPIVVNGSHVVLLGSGAGEGRTEIYADWSGGENESGVPSNGGIWRFQFRPRLPNTMSVLPPRLKTLNPSTPSWRRFTA